MIVTAATFSLSQARECLNRWPERHPFAALKRAWVGFDTDAGDASPLRRIYDGPALPMRVADVDLDGERGHREQFGESTCDLAPTIEHARQIVAHVLMVHRARDAYAFAVHCHAGLFRSGAVVEWVREDLGVPEHECSNRLAPDLGGRWQGERTYNATLLRLLREAHAGLKPRAEVTR